MRLRARPRDNMLTHFGRKSQLRIIPRLIAIRAFLAQAVLAGLIVEIEQHPLVPADKAQQAA